MSQATTTLPPEDKARVDRLSRDVFTKHLQEALKTAKGEDATIPEILSASSIAFANMLTTIVGAPMAATLLRGLADNVETNAQPKN